MTKQRGFTIMETVVTAGIVAVVLSATIGVLARYTDSDVRSQKFLRAQQLAQAEVDEFMARHAVENSLVSDPARARYYPMPDLGYLVSQYYFHNFPITFPGANYPFNHGAGGSLDPTNVESLFVPLESSPWRSAQGAPSGEANSMFTLRYQLLGLEEGINSDQIHLLINMVSDQPSDLNGKRLTRAQADQLHGRLYNQHFWRPGTQMTSNAATKPAGYVFNPLIADSSPSVSTQAALWNRNARRYRNPYLGHAHFVTKVLIVRVYDRITPEREISHAYGMLPGRVQL